MTLLVCYQETRESVTMFTFWEGRESVILFALAAKRHMFKLVQILCIKPSQEV